MHPKAQAHNQAGRPHCCWSPSLAWLSVRQPERCPQERPESSGDHVPKVPVGNQGDTEASMLNWQNQENQTSGFTFIFLGFSEYAELQVPLFLVLLAIFIVTVMGNLGMIIIIKINPKLHNPMYFFLSHLSLVDFCYSTVVTPKLLENLVVEDRTISFTGCLMQFFFACIFVVTETFMLAVMAYDRFVTVCNPLLYTVAMSQKLCSMLVAALYCWGTVCSLTLTYFLLELSLRGNNIINNFVCEHAAIVAVSCSDPYVSQKIILVSATFNEISSLMIILTSYVFIFITVMKMHSTGGGGGMGRQKAFSTCASHLTAITIFHGTILFLYCVPNSKSSWLMVKVASVFYTEVIPMLNPLLYSLRNKEVKEMVKKLINYKLFCHI
ncbi:olfactory receptor 5D13-like [Cynocephalus volans]|uniref:olfactory receptor 5D13-like n=1 Tax=Cynocephalus volans TaxID=110931 RepID=UPI002FCB6417